MATFIRTLSYCSRVNGPWAVNLTPSPFEVKNDSLSLTTGQAARQHDSVSNAEARVYRLSDRAASQACCRPFIARGHSFSK